MCETFAVQLESADESTKEKIERTHSYRCRGIKHQMKADIQAAQ